MRFNLSKRVSSVLRKIKREFSAIISSDSEKVMKKHKSHIVKAKITELAKYYFVEVVSECNLSCVLCPFGNRELFQREKGMMSLAKFELILDKIKKESPSARVSPYSYCEPSLHPQLPELVRAIKSRGLSCAISTNLNHLGRLEDLLSEKPDELEISVSGFYQETYSKSHINGDIEKVKNNMRFLRETIDKLEIKPSVLVIYHMYSDNLGEDFDKMKEFVQSLGFDFSPIWARSISVEMSLKHLREKKLSRYDGDTLDWFDNMPKLKDTHNAALDRIVYLPEDFLADEWKKVHIKTCPINKLMINIKWTGQISLCCVSFDDRLVAGDYLTTSTKDLFKLRKTHPICKECLANNYGFYETYTDFDLINKIAHSRLGDEFAANRKFGG